MKTILRISACLAATASATIVCGHGIPITVGVDGNNKLIVSNTQPLYTATQLTSGYAPMVLVDNEDADVMDHITVNSAPLGLQGPYAFTTLPGFNVTGMAPDSGLFLQVIPRPVMGTNPVSARLLWHWSLAASQDPQHPNPVAVDPLGESLVIASAPDNTVQSITVPQTAGAPLSIKVADPTAADLGTHQHYLEYLLGDSPPADIGAYGIFARLTSPSYSASDPFLLILNNGMYDDDNPGILLTAALAINNAALLAGDFNHDDAVNSADLALWKSSFGSTTQLAADGNGDGIVDAADYAIWRDHLGQQFSGSGSAAGSGLAVPEPSTTELFLPAALAAALAYFGVPKKTLRV
jgi:hypothetical protein